MSNGWGTGLTGFGKTDEGSTFQYLEKEYNNTVTESHGIS
jgi:hypothetical protein